MRIALRYVAAPVLATAIAVTIFATTASAANSPNPGGDYCGQFCGAYRDYSTPDEAAAPASYGVRMPSEDPLSPVWIQLPIVDAAGIPVPQH